MNIDNIDKKELEKILLNQDAKNIQEMFNAISPRYDLLNRVLSFRRDVRWRRLTVNALGITADDVILDLACGTGDMIIEILKHKPKEIIGGDFSHSMLLQAKNKVAAPFVTADACALPFADNTFSIVTISFGFRNVMDKALALKEMSRVIKPGGKVCILEFTKPKSFIFSRLYWLYFKFVLPVVGAVISRHKAAYTYLPKSVENFPSEDVYINMIKDAGFKELAINSYDFGICNSVIGIKI